MSGDWEAELRQVLAEHFCRYPLMEPTDAVKLVYQNEMGGGHLFIDPAGSLRRLREECASTPDRPGQALLEDIGGGRARLHLAAMTERGVTAETVNALFADSCARSAGRHDRLLEKLTLLGRLAAGGELPIPTPEMLSYLTLYRAQGCPMVSHSAAYHRAYTPAYRVVSLQLARERGLA